MRKEEMKDQRETKGEETEQRTVMPKEDSLDGLSRKVRMERERKKLKEMNWKQRIGYVWDYYKIVFVILIGIVFLGSVISTIIHNMRIDTVMQTVFLNCDYLAGDSQTLWQGFEDYLGGLEKDQQLDLDFSLSVNFDSMDNATTAATIKVMAYMSEGSLDSMIMPESVYRHYAGNGTFQKMDEVLSPEELEEWEQYLDAPMRPEEGEEGIYGIRVDEAEKLAESGLYPTEEAVYLAVPVGSLGTDMSVKFLHYLMGDTAAFQQEPESLEG
ncbi:MAG: hypothetical protein Q4E91_01755 [Lachnospiraceae bacterium]|nr:hypothetical protein [Lachnospiraceae bacterium]